MEPPARIFGPAALIRRRLLLHRPPFPTLCRRSAAPQSPRIFFSQSHPQSPNPSRPFSFPLSLSAPSFNHGDGHSLFKPSSGAAGLTWHRPPLPVGSSGPGLCGRREEAEVTVVLLGWLGAREKHLRRYVDWYNSMGFDALTFVVDVRELLCFDLGVRVENRIGDLTEELALWVSEPGEDGRDRALLFHSFSNTGWLVYGALLERLQGRKDVLEKVKGCIVDSGGGGPLDPKVWAAGFSAALLKKRTSAASTAMEPKNFLDQGDDATLKKNEGNGVSLIESTLLLALEKLFCYILKLPDVERKLENIIKVLSENQPLCPQLYLYSTADIVVPSHSIELLIEGQRNTGRRVFLMNFGSSPHVDHFRTFPNKYLSEVGSFLKECLATQ